MAGDFSRMRRHQRAALAALRRMAARARRAAATRARRRRWLAASRRRSAEYGQLGQTSRGQRPPAAKFHTNDGSASANRGITK